MFSLAYRDVQQIVGSILFSGFPRVLTVGFTQMLQHWDVTSAFVEVLAVTDGEPEELSSFFPYCRQTKEHASERGAQSVRVATTTATATSALPAAAPPAARRASARCTGRSRAPNGIGLGEEGREQGGREEGESLVAEEGGGGVSGAFSAVPVIDVFVARWSIFVSLFLCSFLPFPRSDRGRPTLLLHPRCVENCPDEECAAAAALTVRFGGFDSRIHFKKIESRNF